MKFGANSKKKKRCGGKGKGKDKGKGKGRNKRKRWAAAIPYLFPLFHGKIHLFMLLPMNRLGRERTYFSLCL